MTPIVHHGKFWVQCPDRVKSTYGVTAPIPSA
jgi:hypothetical protein